MSSDFFLDKKRLKKLDKELQSMINRTGSDKKTEDEVFDKKTLKVLEKFISDGVIDYLDFPISTGKEGNVFRGVTSDKKFVAVKIYRTSNSTFKHIAKYIIGDPRFESINKKGHNLIYEWTKKEFKNLSRVKTLDINAPKPIINIKNVLVMQYLGDDKQPAPLLKEIEIDNPEEIFELLIGFIKKMYHKAKLVHADFSAFNVLIYRKKPYIIDFGQAVLLDHPNSDEFLRRDISNICNYFKKYNMNYKPDQIYNYIINNKKNNSNYRR